MQTKQKFTSQTTNFIKNTYTLSMFGIYSVFKFNMMGEIPHLS